MEPLSAPVSISNAHKTYSLDEQTIVALVLRICEKEEATLTSLSIVLSDHKTVLSLNQDYLAHDYVTDVLSFALNDEEELRVVDGEIYVDLDTAFERCEEFAASFEHEAYRYIVHGLLHLIGYEDNTAEKKEQMHFKENLYLAGLTES